ncbi:MAG: hypothetical protein CVV64_16605 [Candidatus Wallbacteria bacterium HGW-Wallbacteria-1]|uniref:Uncharacterized protein n=1 Tax=Candidatus Wallbacteria bacterium HGW-Wallbacteria-1 TaxID=2013854 RepID=A0A2N1PKT6_9BACT|nr:MAG: hypothetical protein CVV64_16605 [Candidatus Wallbacteria bacterium HGW-Wallbacteria-1]
MTENEYENFGAVEKEVRLAKLRKGRNFLFIVAMSLMSSSARIKSDTLMYVAAFVSLGALVLFFKCRALERQIEGFLDYLEEEQSSAEEAGAQECVDIEPLIGHQLQGKIHAEIKLSEPVTLTNRQGEAIKIPAGEVGLALEVFHEPRDGDGEIDTDIIRFQWEIGENAFEGFHSPDFVFQYLTRDGAEPCVFFSHADQRVRNLFQNNLLLRDMLEVLEDRFYATLPIEDCTEDILRKYLEFRIHIAHDPEQSDHLWILVPNLVTPEQDPIEPFIGKVPIMEFLLSPSIQYSEEEEMWLYPKHLTESGLS